MIKALADDIAFVVAGNNGNQRNQMWLTEPEKTSLSGIPDTP